MYMKKKPTIDLKVNDWGKLTPKQRKAAAKWMHELMDDLVRISGSVHDRFTGRWP